MLSVENYVDKCVENVWTERIFQIGRFRPVFNVIHPLILGFSESFPRIFDRKRYKLINFAPKTEIVDNCFIEPVLNKLVSTTDVNNDKPQRDKLSGKKTGQKF